MPKLSHRLPKYRLHKASGQAIVTLNGFDHYLGTYNSRESKQAYQRKVSEWLASNKLNAANPSLVSDATVDEVFVRYWAHVKSYYVKDGEQTGEQHALHSALTPLINLYGPTPASEFGPLELKAVREAMIKQKLSRRLINQRVNRIRRMFKWAVENAYLHPSILHGLQAVSPLKRGRCEPHNSQAWGWKWFPAATVEDEDGHTSRSGVSKPSGECIGWIEGCDLYLSCTSTPTPVSGLRSER